jgi:hypothetical protein
MRRLLFEQFKENLGLAREFAATARAGLRSARAALRKAPEKRTAWLLGPALVVVSAVAEHFSVPWYYGVAVLALVIVLVSLGFGMRKAMRRKLP